MIREPKKSAGAGFKNLEFVRFNEMGDSIVRSVNSEGEYGDEIVIKRGLRGYTGDAGIEKPDKPEPPFNVPYGTIVEWSGDTPPEGWLFTLGGKIDKREYPQMINILELANNINGEYLKIDNSIQFINFSDTPDSYDTNMYRNSLRYILDNKDSNACYFYADKLNGFNKIYTLTMGDWYYKNSNGTSGRFEGLTTLVVEGGYNGQCLLTSKGGISISTKVIGFVNNNGGLVLSSRSDIDVKLGYIKIDSLSAKGTAAMKINANSSYIDGNYGNNGYMDDIDWYMIIERFDISQNKFIRIKEIHNKTDFINAGDGEHYICSFEDNMINLDTIRISMDFDKSGYNFHLRNNNEWRGIACGGFVIGIFDTNTTSFRNKLIVPTEYDAEGNPKIIYIGQPVELVESSGGGGLS